MINGGESAYFQTDLLNFDAFLIIFHFVRDSLRCYTRFHPSLDRMGLAVDTRSCCTLQVTNEPVKMFARFSKKHIAIINRTYFNWKWVYS